MAFRMQFTGYGFWRNVEYKNTDTLVEDCVPLKEFSWIDYVNINDSFVIAVNMDLSFKKIVKGKYNDFGNEYSFHHNH